MRRTTLHRLLSLRALEEEQAQIELESEIRKLKQVQREKELTGISTRAHRASLKACYLQSDRNQALVHEWQLRIAPRRYRYLETLERNSQALAAALEKQYREKCKQKRQVEIMHAIEEADIAAEQGRKEQSAFDDWSLLRYSTESVNKHAPAWISRIKQKSELNGPEIAYVPRNL